jgi:hypothetical protein
MPSASAVSLHAAVFPLRRGHSPHRPHVPGVKKERGAFRRSADAAPRIETTADYTNTFACGISQTFRPTS